MATTSRTKAQTTKAPAKKTAAKQGAAGKTTSRKPAAKPVNGAATKRRGTGKSRSSALPMPAAETQLLQEGVPGSQVQAAGQELQQPATPAPLDDQALLSVAAYYRDNMLGPEMNQRVKDALSARGITVEQFLEQHAQPAAAPAPAPAAQAGMDDGTLLALMGMYENNTLPVQAHNNVSGELKRRGVTAKQFVEQMRAAAATPAPVAAPAPAAPAEPAKASPVQTPEQAAASIAARTAAQAIPAAQAPEIPGVPAEVAEVVSKAASAFGAAALAALSVARPPHPPRAGGPTGGRRATDPKNGGAPARTAAPAQPAAKSAKTATKGTTVSKERPTQHGVTRMSPGTVGDKLWTGFDKHGGNPSLSEAKAIAAKLGLNETSGALALYQWRKFHGLGKPASETKGRGKK